LDCRNCLRHAEEWLTLTDGIADSAYHGHQHQVPDECRVCSTFIHSTTPLFALDFDAITFLFEFSFTIVRSTNMAQVETNTISSSMGTVLHETVEYRGDPTPVVSEITGVPSTLSSLPDEQPPSAESQGIGFDPNTLKARYDLEREKRLAANPAGVDQYRSIKDGDPVFGHYIEDPYIERKERAPINERVEVLIVGGGYGGQLVAVRLMEAGITDIRIVEKGGDFGGTWYVGDCKSIPI
jgi:hypothetical protein